MNPIKPTVYIVPRWAGNTHSDWYEWLALELNNRYKIEISILEMPDWKEPDIEKSQKFLEENIANIDENTYFIGHSVGCQAILRFVNSKLLENPSLKIGGFLFVAAWFKVDKPWISMKPWLNHQQLNYELISKQVLTRKVILSDNDPFTSNFSNNKREWEEVLNSEVTVYPNRLHFNRLMEPEILSEVETLLKR